VPLHVQADADNPCGFTSAQEGRWASKVDAWWVADTLLQRLQQAAPAAALGGNPVPLSNSSSSSIAEEAAAGASAAAAADSVSPGTPEDSPVRGGAAAEVTSVRGWLGEELATPWEGHDLAAAGEAVVALAASRFARDALLALPAEDVLRVWQEAQAPQRWEFGWLPLAGAAAWLQRVGEIQRHIEHSSSAMLL